MRATLARAAALSALGLLASLQAVPAQAAQEQAPPAPTSLGLPGLVPMASSSLASPVPLSAEYLASNCANCHGTDGRAANGAAMPALAGLPAAYFAEQMRLFRDGGRKATIMHQLARGYTDQEIDALAAYFSKQPASK
jgi:sulfide dehydrogenase cytochrome subunit